MSFPKSGLFFVLLVSAAANTFADQIEQIGSVRIYSSVDSAGVPFFTDILPENPNPPPDAGPAIRQTKPSAKHVAGAGRAVGSSHPQPAAPETLTDASPALSSEAIPLEHLDGGLPPEDH